MNSIGPQPASRLNLTPRLNYGFYPTPIEELTRLRQALRARNGECPRILVKRDDYTGAGFGGNKVRKLEYVLAQAVAEGAQVAITMGGEKSNHARVTAMLCARLGLRCILVLNRAAQQTVSPRLSPASFFIDQMVGAEIHLVSSREERMTRVSELYAQLKQNGEQVVIVPLGASVPLGALGFVRAMQEAAGQLAALKASPGYLFHASSSGGTQAGLIAGCHLTGLTELKVIGVSPDDPAQSIAASVAEIVNGVYSLLETDAPPLRASQVSVLDEYIGPGYGLDTAASIEAIQLLARTEGMLLDPVYTAKAMAALLDWIRTGKLTEDDTVLFWHTGGQLAHFYAPQPGSEV
ncbi:MAG: D-cysteine desulfhydrase family protein [Blastocatellia bacterium]